MMPPVAYLARRHVMRSCHPTTIVPNVACRASTLRVVVESIMTFGEAANSETIGVWNLRKSIVAFAVLSTTDLFGQALSDWMYTGRSLAIFALAGPSDEAKLSKFTIRQLAEPLVSLEQA